MWSGGGDGGGVTGDTAAKPVKDCFNMLLSKPNDIFKETSGGDHSQNIIFS